MSWFSQGYGINHFTERSLYLAHVLEGSARHGREGIQDSAVHIRVGRAAENGEMLEHGQPPPLSFYMDPQPMGGSCFDLGISFPAT